MPCAKTELLVEIVKTSGALPVFVSVKTLAGEAVPAWIDPKSHDVGVNEIVGAPPVPVTVANAGEAGSFEVTEILAARTPLAVGQNFALTVQEPPGARVWAFEQVPIPPKGKSAAFVPMMLSTPMVTFPDPVFVAFVVWTALQDPPGVTTPKLKLVGLKVSAGEPPVPVRGSW